MQIGFRWYGENNDTVKLEDIKQIPGVSNIVWSLHDMAAGEEWSMGKILNVKKHVERYGFNIDVVESVNVHEDIKLGLPTRDRYIDNYKNTIDKLGQIGVKVICYNFMPVFDWIRTDLHKELEDGSNALFFENEKIRTIKPKDLVKKVVENSDLTIAGWEPERLKNLPDLFKAYEGITEEKLFDNLKYFLEKIIPVAEKNNIKMAIHPDDPPKSVFGLPRIVTNKKNILKILDLVNSPSNAITLCTGSLGSNLENDIPDMIKSFNDRIAFAHIRNVKVFNNGDFIESSHRSSDGSLDMCEIIKAFREINFNGHVRPDHGRNIWNEKCRAGYGLYDRALGIMYILGALDMYDKLR